MKIVCELYGHESRQIVTSTEIEIGDFNAFGPLNNNPFPASHHLSTVIRVNRAFIRYEVIPAMGDVCIYP